MLEVILYFFIKVNNKLQFHSCKQKVQIGELLFDVIVFSLTKKRKKENTLISNSGSL